MSLFRAAWVNSADAAIWHFESAEIRAISKTERILIFKTFPHASLPSTGYFDPCVTPAWLFFRSQTDLHFDGFAFQLIEALPRNGVAAFRLTSGVRCLAIKDFDNASLRT